MKDYQKRGYSVEYVDVKKDPDKLAEMLKLSRGDRKVPVLLENGKVSVGYGGG